MSMAPPFSAGRIGGGAGRSSRACSGGGRAPDGPRSSSGPEPGRPAARAMSIGSSMSGAGGRPSGRFGRRRQIRRRFRTAIAARTGVGRSVHRQIEMEMVVMEHVGAGAEHRGEVLAGAGVNLVQERRLLTVGLLPVANDADLAPVRELEAGDIDGVAERVFRQSRAWNVVDAAAAIGAEGLQADDVGAEARLGARLHDLGEPSLERRDHRAIDRHRLVDAHRPVGERRHFERMGHAADARPVDFGLRRDIGGRLDQFARQAEVFGLRAPDRTLRALEPAAAAERQQGEDAQRFWPYATRHCVKMRALPKESLNQASGHGDAAVCGQGTAARASGRRFGESGR